jgi:hypothetical protein
VNPTHYTEELCLIVQLFLFSSGIVPMLKKTFLTFGKKQKGKGFEDCKLVRFAILDF